jgi:hypothetical protein
MRAPTRRRLGGLVLALGLAGTLTSAPAQAAEGSPPVAVDDTVTLRFGQSAELDVLDNDSDPDGDDLEVCRLGKLPRHLQVFSTGEGNLYIAPGVRDRGTFTFTYYACDFEFLSPATVTVIVPPTPEVRVQKAPDHPGFLRVKNTAPFAIRFLFGSRSEEKPDGVRRIEAKEAVFVRVHRPQIYWVAVSRHAFVAQGLVRNIRLDRRAPAPTPTALTQRQLETWQRSVSR